MRRSTAGLEPVPLTPRDDHEIRRELTGRDLADWHEPRCPDGHARVLDPAFGQAASALPVAERVMAVQRVTGVPVALLDTRQDPLRISAESDLIDAVLRFTGSRTSYPHGVAVSVHLPLSFPDPDPQNAADTLTAIDACGLFEAGVLVVDGARVRATGYRTVAREPVRSWTARSGGWCVTVHGIPAGGSAVRLLGAQGPPVPGHLSTAGAV
ncbi:hypothetical protein [Kitasatospora sp. NPDC059327]|uniref:hypothetical protein n=1 Tax=Kitasatospora sp. NPDC059327 TaxID=3346803 RepID=UPI0036D1763E